MRRLPRRIDSARLVVRCWEPGDVDVLMAAVADSLEHLRPWMPWVADEPLSRAARLALIAEWDAAWASGGDAIYGAFLRSGDPGSEPDPTPVVVGGTGLHHRIGPGGLEVGYWVHAHHIGQGYATEIARAVTDAAFADPDIDRVEIHHDRANGASAAIPHHLGFRHVGDRPSDPAAPGETGVECTWRTTRPEWFGPTGHRAVGTG